MAFFETLPLRAKTRPESRSVPLPLPPLSVCIITLSLVQVTVFVALLTMDANRQKAGRMDWCCCCTSKKFLEEVRP